MDLPVTIKVKLKKYHELLLEASSRFCDDPQSTVPNITEILYLDLV